LTTIIGVRIRATIPIEEDIMKKDEPGIHAALMEELTSLRQRIAFLEQSEKQSRFLAENMADVAFMVDMNMKTTYVSPSIERVLGYSPAERMNQSVFEQMTPQSLELASTVLAEELEQEKKEGADPDRSRVLELECYHKEGGLRHLETHLKGIRDDKGDLTGFYGLSRDVTERKEAEKNLQYTVETLRHTLETLRKALGATIQAIAAAIELRDPYTAGHQVRSADLARAIAGEMRFSGDQIDAVRMACSIHDIGKLSIPAEILSKPTQLTSLEFMMIQEHAERGYDILKHIESPWPLAEIVYQHHERMNGSGYPRQLKKEEILFEARIIAVADTVESMASDRPYRPAKGIDAALEEIENNRGILFDSDVVDACLRLFREKSYQLKKP
jgi:PAS domain S-box-containing protein